MSDQTTLVVGLGNPDGEYGGTRHNVGHMVVDELCARLGAERSRQQRTRAFTAVARTRPGGPRIILATLATYMNTSGGPTKALLDYFKVPVRQLVVVHDDMDLPFERIRLKRGGGHAGHNGLRDIIAATGSREFARVRVGIGHPSGRKPVPDFVLEPFGKQERGELPLVIARAADATLAIVEDGLEAAQQRFHAPEAGSESSPGGRSERSQQRGERGGRTA